MATHIPASLEGRAGIARVRAWLSANASDDATPLAQRRAAHEAFAAAAPPIEGVTIKPSNFGGVRALTIAPPNATRDMLFVHGGAYVLGSPESHAPLAARYALACQARVHALAYPLAPEHPFPAARDAVMTAWRALVQSNGDAALLGTSAGGGLALAATIALRNAGTTLPSRLLLIGPWIDLTLSGDSLNRNQALDVMLSPTTLAADTQSYANGRRVDNPTLSPLFDDLSGLPPIFVQVGGDEVLLDDTLRLEARVLAAGGACEVEVWEAMTHSWTAFSHYVPEAQQSILHVARAVNDAIKTGHSPV